MTEQEKAAVNSPAYKILNSLRVLFGNRRCGTEQYDKREWSFSEEEILRKIGLYLDMENVSHVDDIIIGLFPELREEK